MTRFTKTFFVGVSVAMLSVVLLWAQARIQRPTNPQTGYSAGVSYSSGGNPTVALFNGEVNVVTDQGADGGPIQRLYDGINAQWEAAGSEFGAGDFITFEGATQNAFDTILTVQDPTVATGTFHLPNNAIAADTYALMFSLLDTNALQVANSIWFNTNEIRWEGASVDAFETVLIAQDADVAVHTFQLPDNSLGGGADTYNVMFSLLDTNALGENNSVWFDTGQLIFEGVTGGADTWEIILTVEDATVGDSTYRLNDNAFADIYPVMFSNYADNSWDTTNSVWGTVGGIHFEGVTADDWEINIVVEDPTVGDQSYAMPNMFQAAALVLAHNGLLAEPAFGTEIVDNSVSDNRLHYMYRKHWFRESPAMEFSGTSGAVCSTTGNPNWFIHDGVTFEMDQKGDTPCEITWAAADGITATIDAAANEGHEITQGITAASPVSFTVQTDGPFYFRTCWEITTVVNTDQVYMGFRSVEAYQDANLLGYADYAMIGYGDRADGGDGDWYTRTLVGAAAVDTDVLAANDVLDGETTCAEVRVAASGAVTYEIDGAVPDAVVAATLDAVVVIPFFFWLSDVQAGDPVIELVYWEVGVGNGS